jgi:hypothetical protein
VVPIAAPSPWSIFTDGAIFLPLILSSFLVREAASTLSSFGWQYPEECSGRSAGLNFANANHLHRKSGLAAARISDRCGTDAQQVL